MSYRFIRKDRYVSAMRWDGTLGGAQKIVDWLGAGYEASICLLPTAKLNFLYIELPSGQQFALQLNEIVVNDRANVVAMTQKEFDENFEVEIYLNRYDNRTMHGTAREILEDLMEQDATPEC